MSGGHDVTALAFTRQDLASSTRDGVDVQRLHAALRLGNSPIDLGFGAHVTAAIRRLSPDLVLAHTPVPFPAEMAYLAARKTELPFVVTYHAGRLRGSSWSLGRIADLDRLTFERRMLSGAARLIAVSPYVRDHALRDHVDRVRIVPPGVDAKRFRPGGKPEPANVLFVGPLSRTYRWKGVDVLWDAFQRIRLRVPSAQLTLVGEGDRLAEFHEKSESLGAAVHLKGRLPEDELVREYQRAAVVVLPSLTEAESFGMTLAEANACGRPVVGSRIGGIPDFVRDGENGLLARPADAADLATKILTLLRDEELAAHLGARGRERVLREHDWDRLAATTETILAEALTPVVAY